MAMGQFIDASLLFNEGLVVLMHMPDTPRRKCLEIGVYDTTRFHRRVQAERGALLLLQFVP